MPFLTNFGGFPGGGGVGVTAAVEVATNSNVADFVAGAPLVVDGQVTQIGWNVLVKDQLDPTENGFYTVIVPGVRWDRATWADTGPELAVITLAFVELGAINADTLWANATDPPITIGVTPIIFVPYASPDLLFDFAFDTASPSVLAVLDTDSIVEWAQIIITTAFDDAAATLELGTPATPGAMMNAGDSDPTTPAVYGAESPLRAAAPATFRLTITPAAATQGAGYVLAKIRL
jgi:hypothetical protein